MREGVRMLAHHASPQGMPTRFGDATTVAKEKARGRQSPVGLLLQIVLFSRNWRRAKLMILILIFLSTSGGKVNRNPLLLNLVNPAIEPLIVNVHEQGRHS